MRAVRNNVKLVLRTLTFGTLRSVLGSTAEVSTYFANRGLRVPLYVMSVDTLGQELIQVYR